MKNNFTVFIIHLFSVAETMSQSHYNLMLLEGWQAPPHGDWLVFLSPNILMFLQLNINFIEMRSMFLSHPVCSKAY